MNKKISKIFGSEWFLYSYMSFVIFGVCIGLSQYYFNPDFAAKIEKGLPYETIYRLLLITLFCLGMMYMAKPLGILLAKNRRVQKWYLEYQERKGLSSWRKTLE